MSESRNPYAPPTAVVADVSIEPHDIGPLIENGRRVPIGNCMLWIRETFKLFFQRPWKWIGTMLLLFALLMAVSLIPFSNLFSSLLWPVFAGGFAIALDSLRQTQNFTLSDVFGGFGRSFSSLVAVGCVALLSSALMLAVFFVMTDSATAMAITLGTGELEAIPPGFWLALTASMVVALPITAATFLAAPLIVLHDVRPVRAMKLSFFGCMKNVVPWILCGLLLILIIVLSMIPLFLGLFVTLPVAVMVFYSMYRDIFVDQSRE